MAPYSVQFAAKEQTMNDKVCKTDTEWRDELSPEQYAVCRCSATEAPFSGKYYDHHETGTYVCAACQAELFSSNAKYESGSGWPSYFPPVAANRLTAPAD